MVGQGQRVLNCLLGLDLTAQLVERGELLGRDLVMGELAKGREQRLARGLEGVDRPSGGRCRVVDFVRETGGELAEGDERLTLPCRRLDRACGAVQPFDE